MSWERVSSDCDRELDEELNNLEKQTNIAHNKDLS